MNEMDGNEEIVLLEVYFQQSRCECRNCRASVRGGFRGDPLADGSFFRKKA